MLSEYQGADLGLRMVARLGVGSSEPRSIQSDRIAPPSPRLGALCCDGSASTSPESNLEVVVMPVVVMAMMVMMAVMVMVTPAPTMMMVMMMAWPPTPAPAMMMVVMPPAMVMVVMTPVLHRLHHRFTVGTGKTGAPGQWSSLCQAGRHDEGQAYGTKGR